MPRVLMVEPRNPRANQRKCLVVKGSFWSWHCPCCYVTCGGFEKHEDAIWDVHVHVSTWHITGADRRNRRRKGQFKFQR